MNLRKIAEMHYPNEAGNTQDEIYRQSRIDSLEKLLKEQLTIPVVGCTFFCEDEDLGHQTEKCAKQCDGCSWIEKRVAK